MVAACAGSSRSEVRAGWHMSVGAQDPVYRALQPCDRVRLQVRRRTCAQGLCCSACALTGARGAGCAGATRPVVSHLVRGGLLQQGYVGNRLHRVNRCVRARRACGFHHVSHRAIPQLRRSGATRRGRSRRRPELSLAHQGLLGVDLCVAGAERSVAYILTLGTDEAHRRRGLASALLARTLSECQARWLCLPAPAPANATRAGGPPLPPALLARDNVQRCGACVLCAPRLPDASPGKPVLRDTPRTLRRLCAWRLLERWQRAIHRQHRGVCIARCRGGCVAVVCQQLHRCATPGLRAARARKRQE